MKLEAIADWTLNAYMVVLTTLFGAIGFLVRKIFTNERKIEVLEAKLSMMDKIEEDVNVLKQDVKEILVLMIKD